MFVYSSVYNNRVNNIIFFFFFFFSFVSVLKSTGWSMSLGLEVNNLKHVQRHFTPNQYVAMIALSQSILEHQPT